MNLLIIMASMDPLQNFPGDLPEKGGSELLAGNLVVLIFAALVVVIFAAAWAMFFRKPQRPIGLTPEEAVAALGKNGRKRKLKQRYPTLAETGGLPPTRSKG